MTQRDPPSASAPITRRHVLQLMAGTAAVALHPSLLARAGTTAAAGGVAARGFLTSDELVILDAATAAILLTDDLPGARDIGVVDYIQSLLTFMPGTTLCAQCHGAPARAARQRAARGRRRPSRSTCRMRSPSSRRSTACSA